MEDASISLLGTSQSPSQQPISEPSSQQSEGDLSKNTIIVLVMLTLIISILGTWTVLNEVSGIRATASQDSRGPAAANVQLNILSPEEYAKQGTGAATGRVSFNINPAASS